MAHNTNAATCPICADDDSYERSTVGCQETCRSTCSGHCAACHDTLEVCAGCLRHEGDCECAPPEADYEQLGLRSMWGVAS